MKPCIKVNDYLKSFESRHEECNAVLYDDAETIKEA